jgi:hypothetical protein
MSNPKLILEHLNWTTQTIALLSGLKHTEKFRFQNPSNVTFQREEEIWSPMPSKTSTERTTNGQTLASPSLSRHEQYAQTVVALLLSDLIKPFLVCDRKTNNQKRNKSKEIGAPHLLTSSTEHRRDLGEDCDQKAKRTFQMTWELSFR